MTAKILKFPTPEIDPIWETAYAEAYPRDWEQMMIDITRKVDDLDKRTEDLIREMTEEL